eukprot:scaffold42383_cov62-Attheya_sp.AAC.6
MTYWRDGKTLHDGAASTDTERQLNPVDRPNRCPYEASPLSFLSVILTENTSAPALTSIAHGP